MGINPPCLRGSAFYLQGVESFAGVDGNHGKVYASGCFGNQREHLFTNIIFLILALLLISFSSPMSDNGWFPSPGYAFGIAMLVYFLLLVAIVIQNKIFLHRIRIRKHLVITIVNLSLLAFLAFYLFIASGQRALPNSSFVTTSFSLTLYLFGLYTFHRSSSEYALTEIRFIAPFAFPFLAFSLLIDIVSLFPNSKLEKVLLQRSENMAEVLILLAIMGTFLLGVILFFPPLIQYIWKCKPISNPLLRDKLEALCKRAKFRHAGMKTWTIMNHSLTAGIIGIVPRFRYVMFTKRLLDEMPPESVEAILAHEIGHSQRKHLLIYPVIICGMIVATTLFSQFFAEAIQEFFRLQEILHPSPVWKALYPLAFFIPYAMIVTLYFRFVFGYFSRLFERQADLHIFELNIPVEHMHHALNELGFLTGNTHHTPNWHHYSIQERMDFLEQASKDLCLVEKHHLRVKKNLIFFCFILTIFCCLAIHMAPFQQLNNLSRIASGKLSDWINK